jgi:hypothetical protein
LRCYGVSTMKALALVFVGIVASSGCKMICGTQIQGSGKPGTRNVTVGSGKTIGDFKRIEANGAFEIEVKQGPQSDIVITGDDNLVKIVELKLDGDTLKVGTTQDYSTHNKLKLSVTMPAIEGLQVNGSGDAIISGLSGGSSSLQINGSGEIKATGSATKIDAEINGSGDIDATGVTTEEAEASISGSGTIKVNATKTLDANVTGSGEIRYKGSPKVEKNVTGSGDVTPL